MLSLGFGFAQTPDRGSTAFDLSLKIAVTASLLTAVLFVIIEYVDSELIPFSGSYIFVPFGVLSFGVLAYTQWAIRCGRYRLIARVTILAALAGGLAKVALGYFTQVQYR